MNPRRAALLLWIGSGFLAGCTGPPPVSVEPGHPRDVRVIFTTAVDENSDPVSDLRQVSLGPEPVYVYVSWLDVEPRLYAYRLEIFDGDGQLVSVQRMNFEARAATWNTYSWYRPKPNVDAPGTWRFDFYLDDRLVLQSQLEVEP